MPHTRTVLISAAGTGTAFALASRLRSTWGFGVRLITADTNPSHLVSSSVLSDEFYQVPIADQPDYPLVIADVIEREGVDSYVPLLNAELRAAMMLRGQFPRLDVWSSEIAAALCGDKRAAAEWLKGIGIAVPRSYDEHSWDLDATYFVKPTDGSGSREASRMGGSDLLRLSADERARVIVQEVCSGPEITVDSFFDHQRGAARAVARERIETKAGVCTKARVFEDELLSSIARKIGLASAQSGTVCFQLMRGVCGWVVTDLNFRPGAGTAMTCAAGVDVLSAAFACRWAEDYEHLVSAALPSDGLFVTRQHAEFVMTAP